ncbi:cilia- and flagella-associated protein 161-like [Haliotis rufescens]|uniref:cilia- and flagella-associated protein 161-like n=1 Tax=Haliotis rufescens TaxID=6454 RepID=UPI00201F0B7E|nr:cilia- and flagella-associated protein 161-like [Haliotis rufescens]
MNVRTYNPSVRVGNWNEDIQLEEDTLKDFLERKQKGQLLIQQSHSLGATLLQKRDLSVSRDGCVHFGDVVMLTCQEAADRTKYSSGVNPRDQCALAASSTDISGTRNLEPVLRSVFVIKSVDGSADGQPLSYGQAFHLSTVDEAGNLLLHSDQVSFRKSAKKSRHQVVSLVSEASYLTQWQVKCRDPRVRMEFEGAPVPANEQVIITHCKTNQNLAVEQAFLLRTTMGQEYEISCNTYLNSHKAEEDVNKWVFKLSMPGNDFYPVAKETSNATSESSPPTSANAVQND